MSTSRKRGHTLIVALLCAALVSLGWASWLGATLPTTSHRWHWVALDAVEAAGLLATSFFVWRRRGTSAAISAAASAPLFTYDVCQDIVGSHQLGAEFAMAIVMAVAVEIPTAGALVWVAMRPRSVAGS